MQRDTLTQCPACEGKGKRLIENVAGVGRYSVTECRWCGGAKGVPKSVLVKWNRLQRVLFYRKLARERQAHPK